MKLIDRFYINKELKKLNKKEYKVIKDLSFKSRNKIIKIDYLVVSRYGIFVLYLEDKLNKISGDIYNNYLINEYKNKTFKIPNSTKINYSHVISISNILRMDSNLFIPIVCLNNKTKLNIDKTFNQIININNLIYIIYKYDKQVYTGDVKELYKYILSISIKNKKEQPKKVEVCPNCGSKLVLRKGKYGSFFGCSNYPKCKYTKKQ